MPEGFIFEEWFRSGVKDSCHYSILKGGPNSNDEWVTQFKFERLGRELIVEMDSVQAKKWQRELLIWIASWWYIAKSKELK